MSIIHKQLALADVEPGMVLSDDLLDSQGHTLLPKGATLTEQTITSLQRHHVDSLRIVAGELTEEEMKQQRAHFQMRIERLFRRLDHSQANGLLYDYISNFRLGEK